MTELKQGELYLVDPTIHQVIKIEPALNCSSCGHKAANAALIIASCRFEGLHGHQKKITTSEWLLKPTCGICAEGLASTYPKMAGYQAPANT